MPATRSFRSRRVAPPTAEGRWSLIASGAGRVSPTESATALAQQLLARYGVLTREVAAAEGITGGFSAVYDVLKALEDAGRIRRGYFASGVGATQFALAGGARAAALAQGHAGRTGSRSSCGHRPCQPVRHDSALAGAAAREGRGRGPTRTVGSVVVIVNGALAAYISRGARQLLAFLPEDEPARSMTGRAVRQDTGAHRRCWCTRSTAFQPPITRWPSISSRPDSTRRRWDSRSVRADLAAAHDGLRAVSETLMPEGDTIFRAARRCTARSPDTASSGSNRCFRH